MPGPWKRLHPECSKMNNRTSLMICFAVQLNRMKTSEQKSKNTRNALHRTSRKLLSTSSGFCKSFSRSLRAEPFPADARRKSFQSSCFISAQQAKFSPKCSSHALTKIKPQGEQVWKHLQTSLFHHHFIVFHGHSDDIFGIFWYFLAQLNQPSLHDSFPNTSFL